MGSKKYICSNCGTVFKSVNRSTPKSEGWLVDDLESKGLIFCCCVCKGEYNKHKKKRV